MVTGWQVLVVPTDCSGMVQQLAARAHASSVSYAAEAAFAPKSQLMHTVCPPSLGWHRPSQLRQVATVVHAHECPLAKLCWLPTVGPMVPCATRATVRRVSAIMRLSLHCKDSMMQNCMGCDQPGRACLGKGSTSSRGVPVASLLPL